MTKWLIRFMGVMIGVSLRNFVLSLFMQNDFYDGRYFRGWILLGTTEVRLSTSALSQSILKKIQYE
jgi:hypothetical protein